MEEAIQSATQLRGAGRKESDDPGSTDEERGIDNEIGEGISHVKRRLFLLAHFVVSSMRCV
jgi:hypothetical protein